MITESAHDVAQWLRRLSDKVDTWGKDVIIHGHKITLEVEEDTPERDADGRLWATWKYTGEARYRIDLEMREQNGATAAG